jgi:hypothetical protein
MGDSQKVSNEIGNPMKTDPARTSVHNGIIKAVSTGSGTFRPGCSLSKAISIWPPTSTLFHFPCPMSPLPVIASPSGVEKAYDTSSPCHARRTTLSFL